MMHQPKPNRNDLSDEIESVGNQLVSGVKEALRKGNERRVIITTREGRVILDSTLTVAGIVAAVGVLWLFPLVVLAAIAAVIARVKIDIVREVDDGNESEHLVDAVSRITVDTEDDQKSKRTSDK